MKVLGYAVAGVFALLVAFVVWRILSVPMGMRKRDRRILYLRFFEDRTQAEIGDDLGVTQMQVSRLLSRTLDRLRTSFRESV